MQAVYLYTLQKSEKGWAIGSECFCCYSNSSIASIYGDAEVKPRVDYRAASASDGGYFLQSGEQLKCISTVVDNSLLVPPGFMRAMFRSVPEVQTVVACGSEFTTEDLQVG